MKNMNLFHIIVFLLMKALGLLSSVLPNSFRGNIGILLGKSFKLFSPNRQKITMHNLNIAFPDKSIHEKMQIAARSFENLGITFLELAALNYLNQNNIEKVIELKNHSLINKLIAKGRGLIMLSGHYGNWEYLALSAGLFTGVPITIVVKTQKNKLLSDSVNASRTKFGNKVVDMKNAARSLIKAIRHNEAIAILADQSAQKDKDIFVEFFGKPALTFEAPAELALRFNIPIVYAFAERNSDFTYTAELKELDYSDLTYSKENVALLTERHVRLLEEQIRKNPDLWAWQHRRWKHTDIYGL